MTTQVRDLRGLLDEVIDLTWEFAPVLPGGEIVLDDVELDGPRGRRAPLVPRGDTVPRPVFVDLSGRRRTMTRWCGRVMAAACVGYIALVATGVSAAHVGPLVAVPVLEPQLPEPDQLRGTPGALEQALVPRSRATTSVAGGRSPGTARRTASRTTPSHRSLATGRPVPSATAGGRTGR